MSKRELKKKKVSFKIAPKKKNLGIKLIKEVKDLYSKNYNPLMKKIKEM